MGTQEVPARFVHTCDRCGHKQESGQEQPPERWRSINQVNDTVTYNWLLCPECGEAFHKAIRRWMRAEDMEEAP